MWRRRWWWESSADSDPSTPGLLTTDIIRRGSNLKTQKARVAAYRRRTRWHRNKRVPWHRAWRHGTSSRAWRHGTLPSSQRDCCLLPPTVRRLGYHTSPRTSDLSPSSVHKLPALIRPISGIRLYHGTSRSRLQSMWNIVFLRFVVVHMHSVHSP